MSTVLRIYMKYTCVLCGGEKRLASFQWYYDSMS